MNGLGIAWRHLKRRGRESSTWWSVLGGLGVIATLPTGTTLFWLGIVCAVVGVLVPTS